MIETREAVELLNREAPLDYVAEWTAHVSAQKEHEAPGTKSVVIFRIDKEWLAISTGMILEVIDHYTIRSLPERRGGFVKGLINVRGELLLCIALEVVLGLEDSQQRSSSDRLLIFNRGRFAVQVSEIFGVHRYHPDDLRSPPATLRKASSGVYTTGILRWQGKALACLDEALLLYALEKSLA